MYKNLVTTVIATLVAACLNSPAVAQTTSQATPAAVLPEKGPLTNGFVCVAPLTEAGWLRQREAGCKAVEAALGDRVKTSGVENVAEGADAERVIRELASQGWRLISTTRFGRGESDAQILTMDFLAQAVPGQLNQASAPNSVDRTP